MKKDVRIIFEDTEHRYLPNSSIENDVLDKVRHTIDNNKFAGNFYSSLWQGGGDGYLYELDEHDDYLVRRQNLKEGERIYRYFTRRSAFTGQVPLIKINIDKGLLYFLKDDDEGLDLIEFETKGIPVRYLNIIPPQNEEYAEGGKTEQLYSSIKRDRLRALEDEISTLNLMLKKLENENTEESYKESQNLREFKTILEVKKLNLEDIGYDKGGSVDVIKKDRYGNDVKIGDAIHIRVLTGRYGQTKDYEGVVTNFDQFGMVELDGQRSLTYTKDYKFDDYEHGHHIWVEKIKEKDIEENLRVPKKYVSTYSGTINGEKFAINGKDKFQDWLDKNYPSSVLGAWNTLYNKGWKYKNSTKEYLSPENLSYNMIDVYASAEQGQGFSYSLMIPTDKSEYAQGGFMAEGGITDDEGNLIDIKVGDEVVEYKKRFPNAEEKTQIGPKGRIIKIVDAMAKVSYPNDYEEWIALRDLKKMAEGGITDDEGKLELDSDILKQDYDKIVASKLFNLDDVHLAKYAIEIRGGDETLISSYDRYGKHYDTERQGKYFEIPEVIKQLKKIHGYKYSYKITKRTIEGDIEIDEYNLLNKVEKTEQIIFRLTPVIKKMAEGGILDDEGNLIDIKGGGLLMIPNNIADEIKKSISMGYDIIREGLISPKRKGIMLSNEDYKVRGTYPSELKNAIQQMIDNSKMKKGGTLEFGVKKNMIFDKNGERRVDPEALAYIENTVEMLPQTKFMHTKENGQYTPERKKLHDEIIATFHEGKPCIEQRPAVAILTGGAPASGKTTFIKKYVDLDPDKVYHVDADEVRAMLPEYKGYNATQTHLETADMVNQLIDEIGVPCDHDLIYDGTMNKATKYEKIVDKLHKLGYKVFVVYISIPEQVSKERVIARYKKAGRYVPMKVIEEVYDMGLKAFEKVAYEMADGYIRIDGMNGEIIEQGGMLMPSNIEYDKGGQIADNKLKNGTALVRSAERYAEAQTGEAVNKGKGMARAFKLDGKMAYNSVIVFFKNGEHIIYDEDEFPKFFMKDGGELGGQDYYDGFQMQVVQKKGNPDKEVQKENIKMSYRKGGKL